VKTFCHVSGQRASQVSRKAVGTAMFPVQYRKPPLFGKPSGDYNEGAVVDIDLANAPQAVEKY
jgi:hypothetical protein